VGEGLILMNRRDEKMQSAKARFEKDLICAVWDLVGLIDRNRENARPSLCHCLSAGIPFGISVKRPKVYRMLSAAFLQNARKVVFGASMFSR